MHILKEACLGLLTGSSEEREPVANNSGRLGLFKLKESKCFYDLCQGLHLVFKGVLLLLSRKLFGNLEIEIDKGQCFVEFLGISISSLILRF